MPKIKWGRLVTSIAICQLAGIVGSVATASSVKTWYPALAKPFFTPPSWLFGPAWITLYTLMGIALYIVWQKQSPKKAYLEAIQVFAVQLILNASWSIVFFGLKNPKLGLLVIIALWAFILSTILKFAKISKASAWLLVPYLVWVTFATALNLGIVLLN